MENCKLNLEDILMSARWVGLLLIVLGWLQIVPLLFGWIGFGLACISFILESKYKKNLPPPNTDGNPGERPDPNNKDNK
jgi:hypothetical protein